MGLFYYYYAPTTVADFWCSIVYTGGYYYLLTTDWTDIKVRRSATLGGLKSASPKTLWSDSTASRMGNFWAPGKFRRRRLRVVGPRLK